MQLIIKSIWFTVYIVKQPLMALFSYNVLFSHFTPHDAILGNSLMHVQYVRIIHKKQKENSHKSTTWSERLNEENKSYKLNRSIVSKTAEPGEGARGP